jgi:hypothetical protein
VNRARLIDYASDGRRAYPIAEEIFAGIITALRRDLRFRAVAFDALELLLADARREAEIKLVRELRDRIHIDDIGDDQ